MSYIKNTWKAGDTVTSAKLNNIEDGIAAANNSSIFIVHETDDSTLDKTWAEIHDALTNGMIPLIFYEDNIENIGFFIIDGATNEDGNYCIYRHNFNGDSIIYVSSSEDEYPSFSD